MSLYDQNASTAQVHRVGRQPPTHDHVVHLDLHVAEAEQLARFPDEHRAHLDGRGTGLGVDAALVRDGEDEVEVAHRLAEDPRRDVGERQILSLPLPEEHDCLGREALDLGRSSA